MTDQMFVFLCNDVRKHAFDFRRGELQAAEHRKVEEHLASCDKCRDYLNRVEGMLDAAAIQDAPELDRDALFGRIVEQAREEGISDGPALDRDQLFSRITAEIQVLPTPPAVAAEALRMAQETAESDRDDEENQPRRPVALYVIAALAAGILIGVGLGFLYPTGAPVVQPRVVAQQTNARPDPSVVDPATTIALSDLGFQPTPAEFDDVTVFGGPTANWEIRTQGKRRKLDLREGTVLVEFVSRDDRQLDFVADRFTVHVTGTIFYASAERGIVGVVAGSVDVETPGGETVKLEGGQEWLEGEGVRAAPAATRSDAELHVDIDEHMHKLEVVRAEHAQNAQKVKAPQVDAPRPPVSKEVHQTPREQLRAAADRALRNGRYDVAAQYYERMVEELSAADPANASLRLDLARIYIQHLGQERRALVHLRRFATDRPTDPLTPEARRELCRIADAVHSVELECMP